MKASVDFDDDWGHEETVGKMGSVQKAKGGGVKTPVFFFFFLTGLFSIIGWFSKCCIGCVGFECFV